MAYKEGGGKNDSAIHWDMIKDLRKDVVRTALAHANLEEQNQ